MLMKQKFNFLRISLLTIVLFFLNQLNTDFIILSIKFSVFLNFIISHDLMVLEKFCKTFFNLFDSCSNQSFCLFKQLFMSLNVLLSFINKPLNFSFFKLQSSLLQIKFMLLTSKYLLMNLFMFSCQIHYSYWTITLWLRCKCWL